MRNVTVEGKKAAKTAAKLLASAFFACVTLCGGDLARADDDTTRTPNLGIEITQGGHAAQLTPAERGDGYRVYTLTLRAQPFDITIPTTVWGQKREDWIVVALSTDAGFLSHLHIGRAASDNEIINQSFYQAMAWDPKKPGELLTAESLMLNGTVADYGYNALGDHRFATTNGPRLFHATSILARDGFASQLTPGTVMTFLFYLDRGLGTPPNVASTTLPDVTSDDRIDGAEVDVVRVTFTD